MLASSNSNDIKFNRRLKKGHVERVHLILLYVAFIVAQHLIRNAKEITWFLVRWDVTRRRRFVRMSFSEVLRRHQDGDGTYTQKFVEAGERARSPCVCISGV
jgi:hypothetical protein